MFKIILNVMKDKLSQKMKIETLDEFKKYRTSVGFIILVNYREAIIHKSSCSYLSDTKFERSKKEYLWFTKLDNIEHEFNLTKPCSACNPFEKKLTFH